MTQATSNPEPQRQVPLVFVSYVREDLKGSALRPIIEKLTVRLRSLFAAPINVFWDDKSLRTGDHFPSEITAAIQQATVFVPILSPRYFSRKWCVQEMQLALQNKNVSIVPFELIPGWETDTSGTSDQTSLQAMLPLHKFAWEPYRADLRVEDPESVHALFGFADDIKKAVARSGDYATTNLDVPSVADWVHPNEERLGNLDPTGQETIRELTTINSNLNAVVDEAAPGTILELASGRYELGSRITKPLTIRSRAGQDVIIHALDGFASSSPRTHFSEVHIQTAIGSAIVVDGGLALFTDCEMSDIGGIQAAGDAHARLIGCEIAARQGTGLSITEHARVRLIGCSVRDCAVGIHVRGDGLLKARANRIFSNEWGIVVKERGGAEITGCWIYDQTFTGVSCESHGSVSVTRSRAFRNAHCGIYAQSKARITDNVLNANGQAGLVYEDEASANVHGNEICDNAHGVATVSERLLDLIADQNNITRNGNRVIRRGNEA